MITKVSRVLDGELVLATTRSGNPDDPLATGACSFTEPDAVLRAGGEFAERTALFTAGPRAIRSTAQARAAGGTMTPVLPTRAAPGWWVPSVPVSGGEPVWFPADLVLLRWKESRDRPARQTSVGTAAHPDRDRAVVHGVRECLERLAVRQVWSAATGLVPLTDRLPDLLPDGLRAALRRRDLTVRAWLVGAALPVRVVLVMLEGNRVTFGACCADSLPAAVGHALCEAVGVRAALADTGRLKRTGALPAHEVDQAVRAAAFPDAFLAFLRRLEFRADLDGDAEPDVLGHVERAFGVSPAVIDLGRRDGLHVVKVVVPTPAFFVPRHDPGYLLAPGYLE